MTLSFAEQYLLELINRARLDPAAEALRNGIALNAGLEAGQISTRAKQVLVANDLLEHAAIGHSQFMLDANVFSHTGAGGSDPGQRIAAQFYDWTTFGENIALIGSSGPITAEGAIDQLYKNLFLSEEHRVNTLNGSFAEVGLSAEVGQFTQGANTFNAAVLTEDFATRSPLHFLTGVAYADLDDDGFYSMGEGTAGVVFDIGDAAVSASIAGGYGLMAGNGKAVAVTGHQGALQFSLNVDMSPGNVKLDLEGGDTFLASGSITLGGGVNDLILLGVARIDGTGNVLANHLTGNTGGNALTGLGGADHLSGGGGSDVIRGDRGNDVEKGGAGADTFVFQVQGGQDRILDFALGTDVLRLDDALWAGQTLTSAQVVRQFAHVVGHEVLLTFSGGEEIHLTKLLTLAGLAAGIEIF